MGLPDLVEQGLGHGLAACGLHFVADRPALQFGGILGAPTIQGKRPGSAAGIARPAFVPRDRRGIDDEKKSRGFAPGIFGCVPLRGPLYTNLTLFSGSWRTGSP